MVYNTKIMIFGRPGGGKSTFALRLHHKTELPLYHLDKIFYIENWVECDYEEFLQTQQSIVNKNQWIIDGNNIRSLEMRYKRADVVLYFNYPRYQCYWRIIKRRFIKNSGIDDRARGCVETIRLSLLKYIWNFEKRVAAQIIFLKRKYPFTEFREINSQKQLEVIETRLF